MLHNKIDLYKIDCLETYSMEKNIKDYLHLYFGCECICIHDMPKDYGWSKGMKQILNDDFLWDLKQPVYLKGEIIGYWYNYFKPILRHIVNASQYEMNEFCDKFWANDGRDSDLFKNNMFRLQFCDFSNMNVEYVPWLLSKHFDLFGLIEAGLAIDKTGK